MRLQMSAWLIAVSLVLVAPEADAGYPPVTSVTSVGGVSAKTNAGQLSALGRYSIQCEQAARVATGPQASVAASQSSSLFVEAWQRPLPIDLASDEDGIAVIAATGTATTKCNIFKRTGNLAMFWGPQLLRGSMSSARLLLSGLGAPPLAWAGYRRLWMG